MFDECFRKLAVDPAAGRDCGDIREGYRKINVGSHVVFYRQKQNGEVEIVRILHGRMDIESRLSV